MKRKTIGEQIQNRLKELKAVRFDTQNCVETLTSLISEIRKSLVNAKSYKASATEITTISYLLLFTEAESNNESTYKDYSNIDELKKQGRLLTKMEPGACIELIEDLFNKLLERIAAGNGFIDVAGELAAVSVILSECDNVVELKTHIKSEPKLLKSEDIKWFNDPRKN